MEHRGVAFTITEMDYPDGWKWTVTKDHTVSAGVCDTREDADRQARTFIDAIVDWAA